MTSSAGEPALDDAAAVDAGVNAALLQRNFALAEHRLREAITRFGPRPDRLAMLGQALIRLSRPQEAADALQAAYNALAQPPLLVPLGIARLLCDDPHAALVALDEAIAQMPENAEAWNAAGLAHTALADDGRAETAFRGALAASPRFTAALANLCDLLLRTQRADEAHVIAARTAHENVDDAGAWFKLGHLRMLQPDVAGARDALLRSARLQSAYSPTYQNLGILDEWSGDLDSAEIHFRKALSLSDDNADARLGLATILLKRRSAPEGWKLYAEATAGVAKHASRRVPAPRWDGAPMQRGTLLIDADQGLGDVLQYIRFVPLARARVARIVVFCDDYRAPLKPLLESMSAIDAVVDRSARVQGVVATCNASELPHLLGLGESAFAATGAYLTPVPAAVERWAARVAGLDGVKVGICWGGNPRTDRADAHRIDVRRSIAARQLASLAGIPNLTLVSLQKGVPRDAGSALGPRLVDWTDELVDFAETAALIANLDLVVSVDTSIVHCAGAIGKPVWMLDRFDNCWRWGTDVRNPGWYRDLRVFRQPAFGDWGATVGALQRALEQRVDAPAHTAPR